MNALGGSMPKSSLFIDICPFASRDISPTPGKTPNTIGIVVSSPSRKKPTTVESICKPVGDIPTCFKLELFGGINTGAHGKESVGASILLPCKLYTRTLTRPKYSGSLRSSTTPTNHLNPPSPRFFVVIFPSSHNP